MKVELTIPASLLGIIGRQALDEAPNEACGYLSGVDGRVRSVIRMTNVDASPEHFSLDPAEQFAALKEARERGEALIAVYHSHPAGHAQMSDEDIRLANDPNTVYVIYSVPDESVRAFRVDTEKRVREVGLRIEG